MCKAVLLEPLKVTRYQGIGFVFSDYKAPFDVSAIPYRGAMAALLSG